LLTLPAVDILPDAFFRRAALKSSYFFFCQCRRCNDETVGPPPQRHGALCSCGGAALRRADSNFGCGACGREIKAEAVGALGERLGRVKRAAESFLAAGEADKAVKATFEFVAAAKRCVLATHFLMVEGLQLAQRALVGCRRFEDALKVAKRVLKAQRGGYPSNHPAVRCFGLS
jgi:hypothetical protein